MKFSNFSRMSIFTLVITVMIFSTENCRSQTIQTGKQVYNFKKCQVGALPEGWITAMTGKGNPGNWLVAIDETDSVRKKVLSQTSMNNFGYHFDVAVFEKSSFKNIEFSVRFKAIKGTEDQGGGPVWRYQDKDNYYIARANPLENNFRLYKVIAGNRKLLVSRNLPVSTGQWHTIKIAHVGNDIKCYYDGKLYLKTSDKTIVKTGKIGVWTKADSWCMFSDLTVEEK